MNTDEGDMEAANEKSSGQQPKTRVSRSRPQGLAKSYLRGAADSRHRLYWAAQENGAEDDAQSHHGEQEEGRRPAVLVEQYLADGHHRELAGGAERGYET